GHAKRGQDYDIIGFDSAVVDVGMGDGGWGMGSRSPGFSASRVPSPPSPVPLLLSRHQELNSHRLEIRVHVRVMDDLSSQVDGTIRELLSGLVGILNGSFDPVTEAKFLGQTDGDFAGRE